MALSVFEILDFGKMQTGNWAVVPVYSFQQTVFKGNVLPAEI
jgi:hypothetical protein